MAAKPKLTNAARPATFDVEAYNERGEMVPTAIAGEHPLTIYLDKRELVTLMTLGAAPELLALGYLRNQQLVGSLAEIESVTVDWEVGAAAVKTRAGASDFEARTAKRIVTTTRKTRGDDIDAACGQLVGKVQSRQKNRLSGIPVVTQ